MRILLALTLVFVSVQIFSQDTHYWTYRYGTKAVLMSGAAVGGLEDNTSVIYNPALLSFVKSTSISINSNIYQIVNITAKNGAGPGQDVISNQFSAVPVTLSGMIRKKKPSRLTMGYAIIVPSEFTFKATVREDAFKDIVTAGTESLGAEDYVGQFTINTRLSENQGAFALAYKISDKFSVGLTNQFVYRSHSYTKNELCRMILNNSPTQGNGTLVNTSESQSIEYTNLRYSPKIGLAFASGRWTAGLAVVLPSVTLGGSGTIARDIIANSLQINLEPNPSRPPILVRSSFAANDRQEKLSTTYNTPLSISAGFAYKGSKWLVAASAEWFGSVSLYNIMTPQDNLFKRPITLQLDGKKFLEVNASNKSVVNFAVGVEHSLNDKISLSTGFRTNRSFYDKAFDQRITDRNGRTINNNPLNLDISSWDIYHVVLGGTFKQERRDLSIGITYSWANDGNIRQFANFDQPTENTFLLGQKLTTTASYYSFGVLLGYTLRIRSEN
jgi:long-subunit fatty acid transport protein